MGERGVGAKLPAQAFRRNELHAVEAVANETWRQVETGESFHAYDAAAVVGVSNLAVLFEHADMKARAGKVRSGGQPGRARADYEYVKFIFNGQSFFSLTSHLPRKVIQNDRKMSLRSSQNDRLST